MYKIKAASLASSSIGSGHKLSNLHRKHARRIVDRLQHAALQKEEQEICCAQRILFAANRVLGVVACGSEKLQATEFGQGYCNTTTGFETLEGINTLEYVIM